MAIGERNIFYGAITVKDSNTSFSSKERYYQRVLGKIEVY